MSENFIDAQNKAYLFLAKQYANETANKALSEATNLILQKEKQLLQADEMLVNKVESLALSVVSKAQIPCLATEDCVRDSDYPVGSIISISVICSDIDASLPYLEDGIKVNSLVNNIYLNTDDRKLSQTFHWFNGKTISDSSYSLLPGVWRSRGICGGFKNDIVGVKYYLAQRVK
jgi:hypothetical protein